MFQRFLGLVVFSVIYFSVWVSGSYSENSAVCMSVDNFYSYPATKDCCASTQGTPITFHEDAGACTNNVLQGINLDAFNYCCIERGFTAVLGIIPCNMGCVNKGVFKITLESQFP